MVKNYNNNVAEWHYWDNIHRVVDERILHLDDYDLTKMGCHIDDTTVLISIERLRLKKDKKILVGVLRCYQNSTREYFRIFFNTEAYICNDDGKTITKTVIYSRSAIK